MPLDGGIRGGSPTGGQREARPPVQLLFGTSKRGRTSSVKVFLGIANQSRPASVGNSVVLGVFPCRTDDCTALQRICAVWLADVEDLRSNGLSLAGQRRAVRLILTGDIAWMTAFCGHAGSSSRHPFLMCTALGPRWAGDGPLVAFYSCLQLSSQCRGSPRTVEQSLDVCRALETCVENADLPQQLTHDQHRSIQRRPLLFLPPEEIAPSPLHLTLGMASDTLRLAAEVVHASAGPARATVFCTELGQLLLNRAGVEPAP